MKRRFLFYVEQNYSFPILRPIQKQIRAKNHDVAWFLVGNEIDRNLIESDETQLFSVEDVNSYNPDAVLVPGNYVPNFIKGLKVAVFHGFNARKRTRNKLDSHFAIRGCFDLYCTQGPSTTSIFKQLANEYGFFHVIETGWPKVDPLFQSTETALLNNDKVNYQYPTILLTSTFTKELSCAETLFPTIKNLVLTTPWNWLVQFHPKMDKNTVKKYKTIEADNYQFIETTDITSYLKQANVMISDTSSVLQEFLLLKKPVITFKNRMPGPWLINIEDSKELKKSIEFALTNPKQLISNIEQYTNELHPYQDGNSSIRVLDAIETVLLSPKLKNAKPRNFIRNFKMRKKLNYWRW